MEFGVFFWKVRVWDETAPRNTALARAWMHTRHREHKPPVCCASVRTSPFVFPSEDATLSSRYYGVIHNSQMKLRLTNMPNIYNSLVEELAFYQDHFDS